MGGGGSRSGDWGGGREARPEGRACPTRAVREVAKETLVVRIGLGSITSLTTARLMSSGVGMLPAPCVAGLARSAKRVDDRHQESRHPLPMNLPADS
jgi:hypothetical protein